MMKQGSDDKRPPKSRDKYLQAVSLEAVIEKRHLDQALNVKEFAICAGISYSTARYWFRLPGFPVFQGVIFWSDFEQWRASQTGLCQSTSVIAEDVAPASLEDFPPRAAKILAETGGIPPRHDTH